MSFSQILTNTAYSRVPLGNTKHHFVRLLFSTQILILSSTRILIVIDNLLRYHKQLRLRSYSEVSSKQILKARCVVPEKILTIVHKFTHYAWVHVARKQQCSLQKKFFVTTRAIYQIHLDSIKMVSRAVY